MIRALLFDLDGVVIDSEPLYQKGEIRLFAEYDVTIPDQDWKLFKGCTEQMFYNLAMERYKIKEDLESFRNKGRRYVLEAFTESLDYMPGFLPLINRLHNKYEVGLVTATPEYTFNWIDNRLGLRKFFKNVLVGGMTINGKPHPEPYLKMMEIVRVKPAETIVLEDSVHGINSGLNAGAKVIALTGSLPIDELPKTDALVHHLDEVTDELISKLGCG